MSKLMERYPSVLIFVLFIVFVASFIGMVASYPKRTQAIYKEKVEYVEGLKKESEAISEESVLPKYEAMIENYEEDREAISKIINDFVKEARGGIQSRDDYKAVFSKIEDRFTDSFAKKLLIGTMFQDHNGEWVFPYKGVNWIDISFGQLDVEKENIPVFVAFESKRGAAVPNYKGKEENLQTSVEYFIFDYNLPTGKASTVERLQPDKISQMNKYDTRPKEERGHRDYEKNLGADGLISGGESDE